MFKIIIAMCVCFLWSLYASANIQKICDYKTEEFAKIVQRVFTLLKTSI